MKAKVQPISALGYAVDVLSELPQDHPVVVLELLV